MSKPIIIEPELTRPNTVEMLEVPGGYRVVVGFSFELRQGTNNIGKVIDLVDSEITSARLDVLRKLGNKLGVKINFEE